MAKLSKRLTSLGEAAPAGVPVDRAGIAAPPSAVSPDISVTVRRPPHVPSDVTIAESTPAQVLVSDNAVSPVSHDTRQITEDLQIVTTKARQTRQSVEVMRERLARQGQVLRPRVSASMAEVESLVEQARTDIERGDIDTAEDMLRRADYMIRRIAETVGR